MKRMFLPVVISMLVLSGSPLSAETVKDREGAVRNDKAKMENSNRWVYGDYRSALAKGRETGKPVMVTLRCVPCLACSGFDAEVLRERADLSWVLHRAPAPALLPVVVMRNGWQGTLEIALTNGWREQPDGTKRVGTWPMRMMALGGMKLQDLDDATRARRKIPPDHLALETVHVGQYNQHAAAKRAGFKQGDVLVQVNGAKNRMTESQLIAALLRSHQRGERVGVTVLRGGREIDLRLPMQ